MRQGHKTMPDFDKRSTFRVRDTGALLVCKCTCTWCRAAGVTGTTEHCEHCSIGRHLIRARRRAETKTAAVAAEMAATFDETGQLPPEVTAQLAGDTRGKVQVDGRD